MDEPMVAIIAGVVAAVIGLVGTLGGALLTVYLSRRFRSRQP
jgi:hypothetical protein